MEEKVLLSTFSFLCLFSIVIGYQSFQVQIPNGNRVNHPCGVGGWQTVGHITTRMGSPGPRNLFGLDWKNSEFNWKTVCPKDSDLDGLTNGEELGDPNCVWEWGKRPTHPVRGHPGFCDDGRGQCSTDDFAIQEDCKNITFPRRVRPKSSRFQGQPRLPPTEGMEHPQMHLTKHGRQLSLTGLPSFDRSVRTQPRFFQPPSVPAQFPGVAPRFPAVAPQFPGVASQFPGLAPQMPGLAPQMPGGSQRFPGVLPMTGVPRRFFERLAGLTVYGTRPGQVHATQAGSRTFPTGTDSVDTTRRVFPAGRSHSFTFFGGPRMTPVGGSGMSRRFPIRSMTADTPMYPGSIGGVVDGSGRAGMRIGASSYPRRRMMMGTEGRVQSGIRF